MRGPPRSHLAKQHQSHRVAAGDLVLSQAFLCGDVGFHLLFIVSTVFQCGELGGVSSVA